MPTTQRTNLNNSLNSLIVPVVDTPQHLLSYHMMLDYTDTEDASVKAIAEQWSLEKSDYYTKAQVDVVLNTKITNPSGASEGEVLTYTGGSIQWAIPTGSTVPTLQQVLDEGNTTDISATFVDNIASPSKYIVLDGPNGKIQVAGATFAQAYIYPNEMGIYDVYTTKLITSGIVHTFESTSSKTITIPTGFNTLGTTTTNYWPTLGGTLALSVNGVAAGINGNISLSIPSLSLAAIGSTPNANGMTLTTGYTLNLQPASKTYGGVITTGDQSFAGRKTFEEIYVHSVTGFTNGVYLSDTGTGMPYESGLFSVANDYALIMYNVDTTVFTIANGKIIASDTNIQIGDGTMKYLMSGDTLTIGDVPGGEGRIYIDKDTNYMSFESDELEISAEVIIQNDTTINSTTVINGELGINTTPNAKAALDVSSTTKGFLPPRMTTTQQNAISSPPEGLFIWNTTIGAPSVKHSSAWKTVAYLNQIPSVLVDPNRLAFGDGGTGLIGSDALQMDGADGLIATKAITAPNIIKQSNTQNDDFTATAGMSYRLEAGIGGDKTVTLPSTPVDGDVIELFNFMDTYTPSWSVGGGWGAVGSGGGSTIPPYTNIKLQYNGTLALWYLVSTYTLAPTKNIVRADLDAFTTNYDAQSLDYTISVNNNSDNVTVTLPNPNYCVGKIYTIKRFDDNSTGDVYVTCASADVQRPSNGTFVASWNLQAWGSPFAILTYQSNGNQWELIGGL